LHVPTELELGIEPKFRQEYVELLGKFGEKKKSLLALEGYINEYKNYRENKKDISESYRRTMNERLRSYSGIRNEILAFEEKLQVFEDELAKLEHGTVKATQKVYPGVKVTIVKNTFEVETDLGRTMRRRGELGKNRKRGFFLLANVTIQIINYRYKFCKNLYNKVISSIICLNKKQKVGVNG